MKINTKEKDFLDKIYVEMKNMDESECELLFEILFEADLSDKNRLIDLVYEFGSKLKVRDKFGRLVFVRLASLFFLL